MVRLVAKYDLVLTVVRYGTTMYHNHTSQNRQCNWPKKELLNAPNELCFFVKKNTFTNLYFVYQTLNFVYVITGVALK